MRLGFFGKAELAIMLETFRAKDCTALALAAAAAGLFLECISGFQLISANSRGAEWSRSISEGGTSGPLAGAPAS